MEFDPKAAAMFFGRRALVRAARRDPALEDFPGRLIALIDPAIEAALISMDIDRAMHQAGVAFNDVRHALDADESGLREDVERACMEAAFLDAGDGNGPGAGTTGAFFHSDARANIAFNILLGLIALGVLAGLSVEHSEEGSGDGAQRVRTEWVFDGAKGLAKVGDLLDVAAVSALIERLMVGAGADLVDRSRTPAPRAGIDPSD